MAYGPTERASSCVEFDRLASLHGWLVEDHADPDDGVWVGRRAVCPASVFNKDQQDAISSLVDSSWWYRVRNSLLIRYVQRYGLSGTMWDVGSGTGVVSKALSDAGYQVVALEPGIRGAVSAAAYRVPSVASTLEGLRLPARCVTAIGLFDVIEHLTDPEALLSECLRVLGPSGQLFVTVPAHSWLWSQADVLAGHQRRYTRKTLSELLEGSGFEIRDCSYRLASLVIPVALTRSIPWRLGYRVEAEVVSKQLGVSSAFLTRSVEGFERMLGSRCPVGTSLFAYASPR